MKPYFCGQRFFNKTEEVLIERHMHDPDTDKFTIITGDIPYSEKEFTERVKGMKNSFYGGHVDDEDLMTGLIAFIAGTALNSKDDGMTLAEAVDDVDTILRNMGLLVGNGEAMFMTGAVVKFRNIMTAIYDGWDVLYGTGRR